MESILRFQELHSPTQKVQVPQIRDSILPITKWALGGKSRGQSFTRVQRAAKTSIREAGFVSPFGEFRHYVGIRQSDGAGSNFISPCECEGFHGKNRWIVKTDFTPVPLDKSAIQSVTPSQIYGWEGVGANADLTPFSEARMPSEEKWYALTGRVVDVKVEADGDIHIALEDATGNNVGTVSAEIPVGPRWCEIRQTVFGWTTQKFPFSVKTAHALKIREPHVITVTGKAYYDIGHAPADHSNRRRTPKDYAVWEIHPVMKMEVIS